MSLLLKPSGSFRHYLSGRDGSSASREGARSPRSGSVSGDASPEFPPKDQLKLRRVFTTHACRRRRQESAPAPGYWRMSSVVKKPLSIANSVPATFRCTSLYNNHVNHFNHMFLSYLFFL